MMFIKTLAIFVDIASLKESCTFVYICVAFFRKLISIDNMGTTIRIFDKIQFFFALRDLRRKNLKAIILLLLAAISYTSWSQDVWLQNHFAPNNGCNLSNSEVVTVLINNNSASFIPSNSITVSYSIDGGAPVSENLMVNLLPGASWNFTFTVQANLSSCGSHTVSVWTTYGPDTNPLNNTQNWTVQNDCTITPGTVTSDILVCEGVNSGNLNLTGWSNGTISSWEYSINGGTSWLPIGNTTTTYAYNNVSTETMYRVQIEGGFCADNTSGIATISVQPQPVQGVMNSDMTLCIDNGNGNLNITGLNSAVNYWEYSDNSGGSWNPIANPLDSYSFSGITTETWYRAQIEGGVCADILSNIAIIQIDQLSVGGTMLSDQTICLGDDADLTLTGSNGTILNWQWTEDFVTWTPISNTTPNYTTPNLISTTFYKAEVQNGVCASEESNVIEVTVVNPPIGGNVTTSADLCENVATGVLSLSGSFGTIVDWEFSDDFGGTWNSTGTNLTTYDYVMLTDSTWFRVIIDGGVCGMTISDTAVINVVPNSVAGFLTKDTSFCIGDSTTLYLTGSIGTSITWEESEDLISWTAISTNPDSLRVIPGVTTHYRVTVQNEFCPSEFTDTITVTVFQLPIVDAGLDAYILQGDTVQLLGSGGIVGVWTPITELSDPNIPDPLCFASTSTTYTYSVMDINGCMNSDDVFVEVEVPFVPSLDIKNVVTMNNDGYNDTWILQGIQDYPNTAVRVFNLYGKQVYTNDNYQNEWDGTFNGKRLSNGTYNYVVIVEGEEPITGNLTLLGNE